ncbi:Hypothetical predicted protein [Octopus vulgaris]|uniref:Uncharacterized protein n=1 Tax=Octopus vulgaris TaxID=6645 RepID=A0AA36BRN9_OCTVU|nr:Hypothetical predicted protein [Octopus vulgaris]
MEKRKWVALRTKYIVVVAIVVEELAGEIVISIILVDIFIIVVVGFVYPRLINNASHSFPEQISDRQRCTHTKNTNHDAIESTASSIPVILQHVRTTPTRNAYPTIAMAVITTSS